MLKYSLIKGFSVNVYNAKRGLPKAGPFFEGYGLRYIYWVGPVKPSLSVFMKATNASS
jgi:hypothetical protein